MSIIAISGSLRKASSNLALLECYSALPDVDACIYHLDGLPVFSPDLEGQSTPAPVTRFAQAVANADGIVIACPEYVHAIPGGMKNAIDWLVSRDEIIGKPIALLHASHRGDEMLESLRRVMGTVSSNFAPEIFERFELVGKSPDDIKRMMDETHHHRRLASFAAKLASHIATTTTA